jgi:uncharacterized cupredoxin-like copper-binding protein
VPGASSFPARIPITGLVDKYWSKWARRLGLLAVLAVAATGAVGCGSSGGGGDASAQLVTVNERDFSITASPKVLQAGDVVFKADNHGPDAHELIVARAPGTSGIHLPFRSDGLTVSEEALQHAIVGSLEPGDAGDVRELHVRLVPGRYVLFCNMAGHFMAGMQTVVTVR